MTRRRQRAYGQAAITIICALMVAGMWVITTRPLLAGLATAIGIAVTLMLAWQIRRDHDFRALDALPSILGYAVGQAAIDLPAVTYPMMLLTVMWMALEACTVAVVWWSVAMAAASILVPLAVFDFGPYDLWIALPLGIVWLLVAMTIGPLTHTLVIGRQAALQRVAELEPLELENAYGARLNELLLARLPDTMVAVVGEDLAYVSVSGNFETNSVLPHMPYVSQRIGDNLSPELSEQLRALVERGRVDPEGAEGVLEIGTLRHQIVVLPLVGPHREPFALMVCRDITQLRVAYDEVARQREISNAVFGDAPSPALVCRADDLRLPIVSANQAFEVLVGRHQGELTSSTLTDLLGLALAPARADEVQEVEAVIEHASGRRIEVAVQYRLLDVAEGAPMAVVHLVDVTSRRQQERLMAQALEQERAAMQTMQYLSSVRSQVIAALSHDMRTPLTSAGGYLELLEDQHPDPATARLIDPIRRALRQIRTMLEDVRNSGRSMDADDEPSWSAVEVAAIARAAVTTTAPLAQQRHQTVLLDVGGRHTARTGDLVVLGEADKLERVVTNLLDNAIKHGRDGGSTVIRVRRVLVDRQEALIGGADEASDAVIEIDVADDGPGIPPELRDRVFEPDVRGARAQDSIPGSGLGLAIVRNVVEAHGGTVEVVQDPAFAPQAITATGEAGPAVEAGFRGATFRVRLPALPSY